MGDEIKVYLPRMVQPVLQLFMQDTSEQKLSTQKVGVVKVWARLGLDETWIGCGLGQMWVWLRWLGGGDGDVEIWVKLGVAKAGLACCTRWKGLFSVIYTHTLIYTHTHLCTCTYTHTYTDAGCFAAMWCQSR